VRRLLTKLKILLSVWRDGEMPSVAKLADKIKELMQVHQQDEYRIKVLTEERDQYERELRLLQMEPNAAEAQLMQLRVHGMSRNGVIGYGVTAFIPEDVLQKVRGMHPQDVSTFVSAIAENLVYRAIKGLWYRSPMNHVAVMVFDSKEPTKLNAVAMVDAAGAPKIMARSTEGIKQVPEPRELPPTPPQIWT
jgi:hypothetical protein